MVDVDIFQLFEYLQLGMNDVVKRLEVLLGGLFGLYLIFFILNYIKEKKSNVLLKEIRDEMKQLNTYLNTATGFPQKKVRKQ